MFSRLFAKILAFLHLPVPPRTFGLLPPNPSPRPLHADRPPAPRSGFML